MRNIIAYVATCNGMLKAFIEIGIVSLGSLVSSREGNWGVHGEIDGLYFAPGEGLLVRGIRLLERWSYFCFLLFKFWGKSLGMWVVTFYSGRFAQGPSTKLTFGHENQERLGWDKCFCLFHIPHVAHLASGPIDQQFDSIKLRVVKMFG